MKYFGSGLSELHKQLGAVIRRPDQLEQSKKLFMELHGFLHLSEIAGTKTNETDRLLCDLTDEEYAVMPTVRDETIAWVIWHIARIEDLTMGILVAESGQVFNREWMERMNAPITDTANALTDDEIIALSRSLQIRELLRYRNEVGTRTREIVGGLTAADMVRSISERAIQRVLSEGGVTKQEDFIWLLDYWGKKDVAGILLMPPTRHEILHLNDCCKWKTQIRKKVGKQ